MLKLYIKYIPELELYLPISKNWSAAVNRISLTLDINTKSMMNCCHDKSLHKLSKHAGCNATAKAKTSVASQASATSSSSALILTLLRFLKGSWSSPIMITIIHISMNSKREEIKFTPPYF